MPDTPHPWRRLARDWPDVPVLRRELPPFVHAETRWRDGHPLAVVLNERLTQVQARCAVAHECEHLDRGAPCEGLRAIVERRVVVATARYLLPDMELVARLLACYGPGRAAEELWVTRRVLLDRLGSLTEIERATRSDRGSRGISAASTSSVPP